MGVDAITLGNHAFRRKRDRPLPRSSDRVVRPANTSRATPGRGLAVVPTANGGRLGVINVLGSLFLHPATSMFEVIDELVEEARRETPVVLVDVHAEATSEKAALARWLDGRVTAVVGTHTHVQTSDATRAPEGHRIHHRCRHDRAARLRDRGRGRPRHPADAHRAPRPFRDGSGWRADRGRARRVRLGDGQGVRRSRPSASRSPDRRGCGSSSQRSTNGNDPREVEVEPVGQRELERDEHRSRERRELDRALAPRDDRHERARARRRGRRRPAAGSRGRGSPRAWYWPQPQIENGELRPAWNPIVRSQNVRSASHSDGSSRRIANAATRRDEERRGEAEHAAELERRVRRPQRRDEKRAELRPARERDR